MSVYQKLIQEYGPLRVWLAGEIIQYLGLVVSVISLLYGLWSISVILFSLSTLIYFYHRPLKVRINRIQRYVETKHERMDEKNADKNYQWSPIFMGLVGGIIAFGFSLCFYLKESLRIDLDAATEKEIVQEELFQICISLGQISLIFLSLVFVGIFLLTRPNGRKKSWMIKEIVK
ncbi:membrane hypothetical protein [Vibrio nigripulchritudo FTn2]|uniref:hypothetical protein n=1 Tax=Vibrio nigripulchritudo TaxID=28173 RepID=UPI0003B1CDA7|nr:hypothetical protein [Vibrio nigripulchritudo]CCN40132.1 membrane hypothetical protein [Vibrio nigripulchritudo FTn2]